MANLKIYIEDDEYAEVKKKADALGLSISNYIRTVLKTASQPVHKDQNIRHDDNILRAIKALVPTLADAFGRAHNKDQELVDKLTQRLLERYNKTYTEGK